jgi:hypothetical protein
MGFSFARIDAQVHALIGGRITAWGWGEITPLSPENAINFPLISDGAVCVKYFAGEWNK